jgi:hypothetical protein
MWRDVPPEVFIVITAPTLIHMQFIFLVIHRPGVLQDFTRMYAPRFLSQGSQNMARWRPGALGETMIPIVKLQKHIYLAKDIIVRGLNDYTNYL